MSETSERYALLLNDAFGIYIPQRWAQHYSEGWDGVDEDVLACLLRGPELEDGDCYWESWDHILENATYTSGDGHVWMLCHNGDLWALRDDIDLDNEKGICE